VLNIFVTYHFLLLQSVTKIMHDSLLLSLRNVYKSSYMVCQLHTFGKAFCSPVINSILRQMSKNVTALQWLSVVTQLCSSLVEDSFMHCCFYLLNWLLHSVKLAEGYIYLYYIIVITDLLLKCSSFAIVGKYSFLALITSSYSCTNRTSDQWYGKEDE